MFFLRIVHAFLLLALNLCILYFLIRNRDVYQRNKRATLLLRKYKKGTLTKQEELILEQFLRDGVLLGYNAFGTLRLSDRALRELFE